jgi:hypothetical protein
VTLLAACAFALLFLLISIRGMDDVTSDITNESLSRSFWLNVTAEVVRSRSSSQAFSCAAEIEGDRGRSDLPEGWRSEMSGKHPLVQVWTIKHCTVQYTKSNVLLTNNHVCKLYSPFFLAMY